MISVEHNRHWLRTGSAANKALCAAFFFLPVAKPPMYLALCAAFVLFIAAGGLSDARREWRALPWGVPALILAFLPLLSLLIHGDQAEELKYIGLSYYWVIAFVTFFAARRHDVVPWLRAFLCGVFVSVVHAYLAIAGLPGLLPWTPASMANYILYSQFLAMAIVILSVLYRHETDKRLKVLYVAAMAIFFVALVSGNGRSGMLAVVVLLPFIFLNIFPRVGGGKLALACVIMLTAIVMSPRVQTRIAAAVNDIRLMQNEVKETSLGYRVDMWSTALDMVREHPVLGSGAAGFKTRWLSTPRTGGGLGFVEPHNAYLFYATSYGLVGLAALIWLYAALLRTGWRYRASLEGGVVFAFAVICVLGSFTNTMFLGAASHATLMLFMGLQGGLLRKEAVQ